MVKVTMTDGSEIEVQGEDLHIYVIDEDSEPEDDDEELFLSDGADEQPPDFF